MAIRLTEDKTSLIKKKLTAVMPQENLEAAVSFFKSHANLENKIDWNKNGLSLATDIQRLMAQTSENRAAQDAEKSKLDDNLLYEDDIFALYAIKSYEEAIFADSAKAFGCSAKWCIGYRDDDQYWRTYTINDGEAFAMLVNKHGKSEPRDSEGNTDKVKWMIEIQGKHSDYKLWYASDNPDDTTTEVTEVIDDIIGKGMKALKTKHAIEAACDKWYSDFDKFRDGIIDLDHHEKVTPDKLARKHVDFICSSKNPTLIVDMTEKSEYNNVVVPDNFPERGDILFTGPEHDAKPSINYFDNKSKIETIFFTNVNVQNGSIKAGDLTLVGSEVSCDEVEADEIMLAGSASLTCEKLTLHNKNEKAQTILCSQDSSVSAGDVTIDKLPATVKCDGSNVVEFDNVNGKESWSSESSPDFGNKSMWDAIIPDAITESTMKRKLDETILDDSEPIYKMSVFIGSLTGAVQKLGASYKVKPTIEIQSDTHFVVTYSYKDTVALYSILADKELMEVPEALERRMRQSDSGFGEMMRHMDLTNVYIDYPNGGIELKFGFKTEDCILIDDTKYKESTMKENRKTRKWPLKEAEKDYKEEAWMLVNDAIDSFEYSDRQVDRIHIKAKDTGDTVIVHVTGMPKVAKKRLSDFIDDNLTKAGFKGTSRVGVFGDEVTVELWKDFDECGEMEESGMMDNGNAGNAGTADGFAAFLTRKGFDFYEAGTMENQGDIDTYEGDGNFMSLFNEYISTETDGTRNFVCATADSRYWYVSSSYDSDEELMDDLAEDDPSSLDVDFCVVCYGA